IHHPPRCDSRQCGLSRRPASSIGREARRGAAEWRRVRRQREVLEGPGSVQHGPGLPDESVGGAAHGFGATVALAPGGGPAATPAARPARARRGFIRRPVGVLSSVPRRWGAGLPRARAELQGSVSGVEGLNAVADRKFLRPGPRPAPSAAAATAKVTVSTTE
ncbi:unnamed protein product, partial [Ectocarpus sp. 12 AP-2014]